MFCREQAALYNERIGQFDQVGANVVAIGNGNSIMASDFVQRYGISFPVYTDPRRDTYELAGMRRGTKINKRLFSSAWRALKGGHLQGRVRGNANQQGGVLVINGEGEVLFSHVDANPGDHAEIGDVVTAVR